MKHLSLLCLILLNFVAGCNTETGTEEKSNIELKDRKFVDQQIKTPIESSVDQKSIPIKEQTALPIQEVQEETKTEGKGQSFSHYELLPVDQVIEDKVLKKFRDDLIENINDRNIDFIKTYFDEQGKWDFGGSTKEQLIENWNEDSWVELQKAVLLGGVFFDEGKKLFIAPYTFKLFPDEFDAFEFEVAIKERVQVYTQKSVNSNIIETLSYSIVKRIYEDDDDYNSDWKKIETSEGVVGYVVGDMIRSPIDYRVGFEKVNNDWKITFFLAGD